MDRKNWSQVSYNEQPQFIILSAIRGPIWQRAIGAYQLANTCRQNNISAQVIDFIDMFNIEELHKTVSKFVSPNLIAIGFSSTFYTGSAPGALSKDPMVSEEMRGQIFLDENLLSIFDYIKSYNPLVKIIAGGANSWQLPSSEKFDAVFHGYSELSVVEYLSELLGRRQSKAIYSTNADCCIVDGDKMPLDIQNLNHRWQSNDFIFSGETLPIEIGRGCIFRCKFCSYPLNGKKKNDYVRDMSLIKDEMVDNWTNFGTTNYFFTDDTFNDSLDKLRAMHMMIKSLPFQIKFWCFLRLELLYAFPEQIDILKDMGLSAASFGVETFHKGAGRAIGKSMDSEKQKSFLLDLYYNKWSEQVSISCGMIVGLPGESIEDLQNSFNWYSTEGKDLAVNWWPLSINPNGHYLSEFDKEYEKWGYTISNLTDWVSPTMTKSIAFEIAKEYNLNGMYKENSPTSTLLMSLLTLGFTFEEIRKWKAKDLPWSKILKKRLVMIKKYKQLLLGPE
ncbi:radical SAM protein [Arenimonas sp.]|nr:radical SAM protein [Candidatus Parcubacteria bacterium]